MRVTCAPLPVEGWETTARLSPPPPHRQREPARRTRDRSARPPHPPPPVPHSHQVPRGVSARREHWWHTPSSPGGLFRGRDPPRRRTVGTGLPCGGGEHSASALRAAGPPPHPLRCACGPVARASRPTRKYPTLFHRSVEQGWLAHRQPRWGPPAPLAPSHLPPHDHTPATTAALTAPSVARCPAALVLFFFLSFSLAWQPRGGCPPVTRAATLLPPPPSLPPPPPFPPPPSVSHRDMSEGADAHAPPPPCRRRHDLRDVRPGAGGPLVGPGTGVRVRV